MPSHSRCCRLEAVHDILILTPAAPPPQHRRLGQQVAQQAQRAHHEAQHGCRGQGRGEEGEGRGTRSWLQAVGAHHQGSAGHGVGQPRPASPTTTALAPPGSPECQMGMLLRRPSWYTHLREQEGARGVCIACGKCTINSGTAHTLVSAPRRSSSRAAATHPHPTHPPTPHPPTPTACPPTWPAAGRAAPGAPRPAP